MVAKFGVDRRKFGIDRGTPKKYPERTEKKTYRDIHDKDIALFGLTKTSLAKSRNVLVVWFIVTQLTIAMT